MYICRDCSLPGRNEKPSPATRKIGFPVLVSVFRDQPAFKLVCADVRQHRPRRDEHFAASTPPGLAEVIILAQQALAPRADGDIKIGVDGFGLQDPGKVQHVIHVSCR